MLIIANLFRISDRATDRSFPNQAGKSSNASLRMRDYQEIIADCWTVLASSDRILNIATREERELIIRRKILGFKGNKTLSFLNLPTSKRVSLASNRRWRVSSELRIKREHFYLICS